MFGEDLNYLFVEFLNTNFGVKVLAVPQNLTKNLSSLSTCLVEKINSSLTEACPSTEGFKFIVQVRAGGFIGFIMSSIQRGCSSV